MYIEYGEKEIAYLSKKDKILGAAIKKIGHVYREADRDIYSSVVRSIVGQQISTAAQVTICNRITANLGDITPENIISAPDDKLQSMGLSFRKVEYIKDFTRKVVSGEFDLEALNHKSDEEVIAELSALKGIGVWTAEMLMIFCMQRPDVLSFGDLAIQRGLRMLYHHRKIDRKLFDKYRRRYSPYATTAGLYIWAIAGGAIPEMKDYAPKKAPASKEKKK